MVISSKAAKGVGHALGQFEYHEDKGYYVQTSTEYSNEGNEGIYLYPDKDDWWWVSPIPGAEKGWLRYPSPSKILPNRGWQYFDGESWQDDLTLTVTRGPLPPLPRQFKVTAKGGTAEDCPICLGVFTRTERWWLGRPVYVNTEEVFLYHGSGDDGWVIGGPFNRGVLKGSRARHSPATEDSWRNSAGKPASVTVTGSD